MVRKSEHNKTCNKCGSDLVCPECGVPCESGTPFSNWLRATEIKASCHDIDYVWHNYKDNWFMTLEEKTHNGTQSIAQKDTQAIVFQFLRSASPREVLTIHGKQTLEYKGHHVIVMENTTPDNGSVKLDGKQITKENLLRFLRTGKK